MMDRILADRDVYSRLGEALRQKHSSELATQLSVFQSALINFANDHGDTIRNDPEFRDKFTQIYRLIGVDALELHIFLESKSSNNEKYLVGLLVRLVEICRLTRDLNGGLISLTELHQRLQESLTVPLEVTLDHVTQAVDLLLTLGKGYELVHINNKKWVKFASNGSSISQDHKKVYELCEFSGGYVTRSLLRDNFGWDSLRAKTVIEEMILGGYLWIDSQDTGGEWKLWEPSWIYK